jgi:LysR family hydrogen peroxide-inducible transcriptional activator
MVASGLGITVLPCSALVERYMSPMLKVIPFKAPVPFRRVALAYRKSFAREQAMDALVEAIHALDISCIRQLREGKKK